MALESERSYNFPTLAIMNLLITGATGFLGSRLIEHLLNQEADYKIIGTGRKFSHDNKWEHKDLSYHLGDLTDKQFVQSLFVNEIDLVINCASLAAPWGDYEKFYQANVLTQKYLIGESIKAEVERFIYISTPSIFFNNKDRLNITESDPVSKNFSNHYSNTKYQAEQLIREAGLPFVIMRPRVLIGRGDTLIIPRLIRSHKEGKLKIMGSGNNLSDVTSVINMAEAIRIAIHTSAINEDYNITNDQPVMLWDTINDIFEKLDLEKVKAKAPSWLLMLAAQFMEMKAKLSSKKEEPVLTKFGVAALTKSVTFNVDKAKKLLGYEPRQSTEEAIEEFVEWYKNF